MEGLHPLLMINDVYLRVCANSHLFLLAGWRIIDIVFADLMLARTAGHILGIDHPYLACECCLVYTCVLL